MKLLSFIWSNSRQMMLAATAAALLSGACNAGLIALVNSAINGAGHPARVLAWGFIALGLSKVLTHFLSQAMLAGFSQGAIAGLRQDLVRKVLGVPLQQLEEVGTPRVLAALTDDVFNITQALLGLPLAFVNLAMLLGGGVYLGWLSWKILLLLMVLVLAGAGGYRLIIASAFRRLHLAREAEDKLFRSFRALTEGLKELKLHRARRSMFLKKNVQHATEIYQRQNIAAELRFIGSQSWSYLLYFALIGVVLFALPRLGDFSQRTLTGYVLTSLYLMGPLAGLLSSGSLFSRAEIALRNVESLGLTLAQRSTEDCPAAAPACPATYECLELEGIVHSYHREQADDRFVLGPINLRFQPGELVFLVGGNGSGKSTLAKILTGLYLPEAGEIRLNGSPVTQANRDEYRQLFSAVFADFYLFDDLLGLEGPNLDQRAGAYLRELHLAHKVKVANGSFSTIAVSQGQRKRLALLAAYLEDRPFYLFDEWAADQDPHFKKVFYKQLLPELKARGKTVLVITHDDAYFHLADRLIKLDYGHLAESEPAEPEPAWA